ncbi:MAG: hypothetical protein H0U28_07730 [Nocardioidaceae bacterium]|nr:hypothetical protein [Nocardioidaceae bacterium]
MSDSTPPPSQPSGPTGSSRPAGGNPLAGSNQFDLAQIGAAILLFIVSLFPAFYSYSTEGGGVSYSTGVNAWHGFFGWFAVLLALGAGGLLAAALFANVRITSMRLIVLGLFAAAAVCLLLALIVVPGGNLEALGIDGGHGFGYWLALLLSLGAAALAFLRKDATH